MSRRDKEGMTLLEGSFFILFDSGDERFALNLLGNIPNISQYLHSVNEQTGWFPVFRVLHLFQIELYETERTVRNEQIAEKLLAQLFACNYDFLKASKVKKFEI